MHIDFATPGGEAGDRVYFQMEFRDVFLTGLDLVGETEALTTVSGSFAYDFIRMTYIPYDEAGHPLAPITAEYDLIRHLGSVAALGSIYALGLSGGTHHDPCSSHPCIPVAVWLRSGRLGWIEAEIQQVNPGKFALRKAGPGGPASFIGEKTSCAATVRLSEMKEGQAWGSAQLLS